MSYGDWDLWGRVQGVDLMGWVNRSCLICQTPYGMASGGQEEPLSSLFPDWLWLCTAMSHRCTEIFAVLLRGKSTKVLKRAGY